MSATGTPKEVEYTREVVCPYCGHEHSDSWDMGVPEADYSEIECESCERTFLATQDMEITYSTKAKPEVES